MSRRARRRLRHFAGGVLRGVLAGLAAALAATLLAGGSNVSVLSGSMEPLLSTGDLVLGLAVEPAEVRPGDVITYSSPDGGGALVTHRVRRVALKGDRAEFVTKGDANRSTETWSMPADGDLRRAAARVPLAGYALAAASDPVGRFLLMAVPVLLLLAHMLIRIWRPLEREGVGARVPG